MVTDELVGRLCIKAAGRDAGLKGVVVAVYDSGYVLLTGPKKLTGLRRRKVNIKHIITLPQKIDVKENASDDEVLDALKKNGLEEFMLEKP